MIIDKPHRRYNPLTGDFVLVSPQRANRPWQGQIEKMSIGQQPRYDPHCYLCPGNSRAGGVKNPDYSATYVFSNDFPSLLDQPEGGSLKVTDLIQAHPARGTNRVLCYSPRHDLTLALMDHAQLNAVVDNWCEQSNELGRKYTWVQLFQNQGDMMGASNPHPHGQVWAIDSMPTEPKKEDAKQREYFLSNQRPLLIEYLQDEISLGERIIITSKNWAVLVPFWATWPYETLILPKRHVLRMADLQGEERADLAVALKQLMIKYDNLFEAPFPYSMGWHGAPYTNMENGHWQLHAHIYPPLLRSAAIRKFMVGYEMLAEAQRDLTAEQAAQRLQALPSIHYSGQ